MAEEPRTSRRRVLQGLGGSTATAARRGPAVFMVHGAAATPPNGRTSRFAAALTAALETAAPELAFVVSTAPRPVHAPLRDGGDGLRDFRIAAALGRIAATPTDLIAVEAAAPDGATLLKVRPARNATSFAGPMAPALEGLAAIADPPRAVDQALIALMLAAHALAAAVNLDPTTALDGRSIGLVERLARSLSGQDHDPAQAVEAAVLGAWADAWIGLAMASPVRLETARIALVAIRETSAASLTPRELVQVDANLAIVGLALGGTPDGSRRLAEALASARGARAGIAPEIEPAAATDLEGLTGEIALRLGLRRRDPVLLAEAARRLSDALATDRGSSSRAHWAKLLDTAISARDDRA